MKHAISGLQSVFIWVMRPLERLAGHISDKAAQRLLTLSFFLMTLQHYVRLSGLGARFLRLAPIPHVLQFFFFDLLGCVIMLLAALFSIRGKLEKKDWNPWLAGVWYAMCLFMLIASVAVSVDWLPDFFIMSLVFPCLFFIWNNRGDYDVLFACLCRAVLWFTGAFVLASMLFCPLTGAQYAGMFTNPNTLGQYMTVTLMAALSLMGAKLRHGFSIKSLFLPLAAIGVAAAFLIFSQSRTALVAALFVLVFWLVVTTWFDHKGKRLRGLIKTAAALLISVVVCYPLCFGAIQLFSGLVNHPVDMFALEQHEALLASSEQASGQEPGQASGQEDTASSDSGEKTAPTQPPAAEGEQAQGASSVPAGESGQEEQNQQSLGGILDGLTDRFSTQGKDANEISTYRFDVWKTYLREVNLFGNANRALYVNEIVGEKKTAHNTYIQVAFDNGVFTAVCYFALNIISAVFAVRFFLRRREQSDYALFPVLVMGGFGVVSLLESVFYPFGSLISFLYWMVQAPVMDRAVFAKRERKGEST